LETGTRLPRTARALAELHQFAIPAIHGLLIGDIDEDVLIAWLCSG